MSRYPTPNYGDQQGLSGGQGGQPGQPGQPGQQYGYGNYGYGQDAQNMGAGAPTYGQPAQNMGAGAPTYGQPAQNMGAGAPTYGQPAQNMGAGAPTYGQPAQNMGAGAPTYGQPETPDQAARGIDQLHMRPLPPELDQSAAQGGGQGGYWGQPGAMPYPSQQQLNAQPAPGQNGDPNVNTMVNGMRDVSLSNNMQPYGAPAPQQAPGTYQPPAYGQAPATQHTSSAQKAPPRPNAIERECGAPREVYGRITNGSARGSAPPPSTSADYIGVDDGSAQPRYIRLTVNSIAEDSELATKSSIPMGVFVTPFADPEPGEAGIPEVDLTTAAGGGPLRCSHCRAYANPGFQFIENGSKFICNVCGATNETPPEHMVNTSPATGQRLDIDYRHEFQYGSVDYIVGNRDYFAREVTPPHYVVCVDVSASALLTGLTTVAMQSISSVLASGALPGATPGAEGGAVIGIITYDENVHFYDARKEGTVSITYLPDTDDPFIPLGSDAFFQTPEQALLTIEKITAQFSLNDPSAVAAEIPRGNALGAALIAAKNALSDFGGKVFVVTGGIPSTGEGKLERRGGNATTEDREKALLKDESPFYEKLAEELADLLVSVDLIIATQQVYVDAATLMRLPRACGGRSFLIQNFDVRKDDVCVRKIIVRAMWGTRAFESLVRVRVSQGLDSGEFMGSFGRPQRRNDVSSPVMGVDSVLVVELKHEGRIPQSSSGSLGNPHRDNLCIQCAVLYTDIYSRRKIRVHTMFTPKTSVLQDMFRSADLDAVVAFMAMRAANAAFAGGKLLSKVREAIIEKTAHMLFVYRKFCNPSSSPTTQLILPETLKLMPVIILGLLKSPAFREQPPGQQGHISADERASSLLFLATARPQDILAFGYPRMTSLVDLPEPAGRPLPTADGSPNENEPTALSPSIPLSSQYIQDDQILLLDAGIMMTLRVGQGVSQEAFESTFDTSSGAYRFRLAEEGASDEANRRAAIIMRVLETRSNLAQVHFAVAGYQDGSEGQYFYPLLVEDKSFNDEKSGTTVNSKWSYNDFLRVAHRRIMDKMAQERAQKELQTWEMLGYQ